ncbi:MAG: nucleotidyltransferase domain-containing protein [Planctomycetota bacterium]
MLKEIFSSKARIALLKLFLLNQAKAYYLREIAAQTGLPIQAVQRETARLLKTGLIDKSASGNRVYYQVNKNCPIYSDLKSIILKSSGMAGLLRQYLNDAGKDDIRIAFIYGSYAKNTENINSDIDLLVIGNITGRKISSLLAPAKSELKREINSNIYSEQEFRSRITKKDHFITGILKEPRIFLIGNANDLKRVIK